MSDEITIRPATKADLPSFEFVFEWHNGQRAKRSALDSWYELAAGAFAAEHPERGVVGQLYYLHARNEREQMYVSPFMFAVRKPFRGRGSGTRLMAEVEAYARANEAAYISLTVDALNTRAKEWYERRGYVAFAEQQSTYEVESSEGGLEMLTADEIVMWLPLDAGGAAR